MGRSSKDKRDIFYRLAKEEGWRARSAFKLLQIQQTLNILEGVTRAVDLCAAPGSWSQVLAQVLRSKNEGAEKPYIVAVDLQDMSPIPGVKCIKGDITSEETARQIIDALGGSKSQIVVCDGAPDVTGLHELDERLQSQLLFAALTIATCILEENGTFVSKFFRASEEGIRFNLSRVNYFFEEVTLAKPRSSRASSMECFIVGRRFRLPAGFTPKVPFPEWPANINLHRGEIPFLACGDLTGFDSETTYPLPEDYVYHDPVQKPINPPYAEAVQMRKTEKLSDKLADGVASTSRVAKTPVVFTLNQNCQENPAIVTKLDSLTLATDNLATEAGEASEGDTFNVGPKLNVNVSFKGGLELLFGGQKDISLALPSRPLEEKWNMESLLEYMKTYVIQERPELFIKDSDIRPGILIFINNTDWELMDGLAYQLIENDKISFISTLHGG